MKDASSVANFKGLSFTGLELTNEAPYLKSPGTWGKVGVGLKMKGFEFSISNILLRRGAETDALNKDKFFLDFSILLGLSSAPKKDATGKDIDGSTGFSLGATGGFTVIGDVSVVAGKEEYKYNSFAVNSVHIDGNLPGLKLNGDIEFFPKAGAPADVTFGEGFFGALNLDITGLGAINATATFGKKAHPTVANSTYRYFIIDMATKFDTPLPLGPGINLTAAGGGIYWHMKKVITGTEPQFLSLDLGPKPGVIYGAGDTYTGDSYVPDILNSSIGVRILAGIASNGKGKAYNMNILFEMAFNDDFGIKSVEFKGVANFLKEPKMDASTKDQNVTTGLTAAINMIYIVEKKDF